MTFQRENEASPMDVEVFLKLSHVIRMMFYTGNGPQTVRVQLVSVADTSSSICNSYGTVVDDCNCEAGPSMHINLYN